MASEATMTFVSKFLCENKFSFLCYMPKSVVAGSVGVSLLLVLKGNVNYIFKVALPSYIFTSDLTSPHPPLDLVLSQFIILVILTGVIISYCSLF